MEYGVLAQSVEHLTFNQVVRGSNPRCLIAERGNGFFIGIMGNPFFYAHGHPKEDAVVLNSGMRNSF